MVLGDEKQALGEKRGLLGTPASLGQGPQLRFPKNSELLEQTAGVKAHGRLISQLDVRTPRRLWLLAAESAAQSVTQRPGQGPPAAPTLC